jgi:hypothetical protein
MRVDDCPFSVGEIGNALEEFTRTRDRESRREHCMKPPVGGAVPTLFQSETFIDGCFRFLLQARRRLA